MRTRRKDENMQKPDCVVTGATGHVGYALVKEMQAKGLYPRLILRKSVPQFDGIPCEIVSGDVTDLDSLCAAFAGMDTVYHLAGVIDIGGGDDDLVWSVNVQGTENVLEACRRCGVKTLVYTSSVDTYLPLENNAVMHEVTEFYPNELEGTYAKTKATATQMVLAAADETLRTVTVYPGACMGPYDFKVSSVGSMVRMFIRGNFPVSLAFGAYNFVDVRDVALGMLSAAENGKSGEGYILTGQAVTVDELLILLADICKDIPQLSKVKAPKIKLSKGFANAVAPLAEVYYKLAKQTPLFTRYSIRKLCSNCNFSYEKAKAELGYAPRPIRDSFRDMVLWILENEPERFA